MALSLELHTLQDIWHGISGQAAHIKMVATALFLAATHAPVNSTQTPTVSRHCDFEVDEAPTGIMVYRREMK